MNLLKSTGTFGFYTIISRLLGYLRDILIAIFLGTGMLADAFFVAFRIPNTFRRLFAEGTFNAAFVPSYSSEITKGKKQANKFANDIFNLLFLGLLFLTIIIEIFMPVFVSIIAPGFVGNLEKMSAHAGAAGTPPQGNEVLAAFGKLFVADFAADKSTIYWSDTLDGTTWTGGATGSIDITNVWPTGYDEIVALAAHNGFLIIFGKDSIVIYSGASAPASMTLEDTISNIGCVSRDCVVSTGKDLIFLDRSGVRSLARTIQEKSSPIGDISRNVNNDIKNLIASETGNIKMHYSPDESFVLVNFPALQQVYVFDTRFPLQDGSYRATTWTNLTPLCFTNLADETLYIGVATGIAQYAGYDDNDGGYQISYFSHPLAFGDSSVLKFLKKVNLTTFDGAESTVVLNWAYDYTNAYKKQAYTLPANNAGQYNISEYNTTAEYASSLSLVNRQKVNASGSGSVVSIGVESTVNGKSIAIQQLNVHALLGRVV